MPIHCPQGAEDQLPHTDGHPLSAVLANPKKPETEPSRTSPAPAREAAQGQAPAPEPAACPTGEDTLPQGEELPRGDEWIHRIDVWLPVALSQEVPGTLLLFANGTRLYVPQSANSILKRVLAYYALDVKALRKLYQQVLRRSQNPPVPLPGRDDVYVPVPARRPASFGRKLAITGYVREGSVADTRLMKDKAGKTYLQMTLHSGHRVDLPLSLARWTRLRAFSRYFLQKLLIRWRAAR
ncbi:MAG: hypothetical protein K6T26_04100 [Alicyclobacillus sp.]|nr:hypothetical protein [Alicyclobacillus sp.]